MELSAGYRNTEVGCIPVDWDVRLLGECSESSSGTTPARSLHARYYVGGSTPWVKTLDLNNSIIFETDESVTDAALRETSLRVHPKGAVLVAMYGGFFQIGRTGLLSFPAAVNQALTAVHPNDKLLDSTYLLYVLNKRVDYWRSVASSSRKDPNITGNDVRAFPLVLPPIAEQRAIAAALSDFDALIAGLEKLIAKKRDLKQAAMQQLLTGQTRLPGFGGEWVEACLGDLARIQRGASPRPIESPVWFDETSSVGWVRISDVTNAGMHLSETQQKLSPLGIQHSRPVERGSLIMSICATVGRPVITEIDVCIHDGFVVFDKPQANMHFLYYVLKWIEPNWSKQGQTGSQMNLNTPLINGTKIMLPPEKEQTAIAEALSAIDTELVALESRLTKNHQFKQGMMQELLTGRTRLV